MARWLVVGLLALLAAGSAQAAGPRLVGATAAERPLVERAIADVREAGLLGGIVRVELATEQVQLSGTAGPAGATGRVLDVTCQAVTSKQRWERSWRASVLAGQIVRLLRRAGIRVLAVSSGRVSGCGAYQARRRGGLRPSLAPEPDPAELRARILARGQAVGLLLRSVEAQPVDGVVVRVVVRLAEEQLLDPAAHVWGSALFARDEGYSAYLDVQAPDGRSLFRVGGEATTRSGSGVAYGVIAETPVARPAIPARYSGPTLLDVAVTTDDRSPGSTRTIDCAQPALGEACDRLLRHRWEYFVPLPGDTACAGMPSWTVHVRGTLGGIPAEVGYDGCSGMPLGRWLRFLDALPPA